jgi:hypothetical protein
MGGSMGSKTIVDGSPVTRGEIRAQVGVPRDARDASMDTGLSAWSLIVCEVMYVDWEAQRVTLRPQSGTREEKPFEAGTPLTFPGAGRRHFFGAMPMVGDFCLVGWVSGNSKGEAGSRLPVILNWFPPPWWMGRDWVPGSDMAPGEGLSTPKERDKWSGVMGRVRFKLRHMEPGHIVASSGQGADLILDEGVTLANRRGNEIRLRDQDQSLIVRSVNQFHAMSGARVYGGPVRREASLLPTQMFSDGDWWDQPNQYVGELMTPTGFLTPDVMNPSPWDRGEMTPGEIFQREPGAEEDSESEFESSFKTTLAGHVDPYTFLSWGPFCDDMGSLNTGDPLQKGREVYGGKIMYRVGLRSAAPGEPPTGVVNNTAPKGPLDDKALCEYRIEVSHDSNGILPVTEQTDGFDADRLPLSDADNAKSPNAPFIEAVYGSVIGNDPFGDNQLYGLPLVPVVFEGSSASPGIVSGLGRPVGDHAASMFRMKSPTGGGTTWWSVTKSGVLKSFLGGAGDSVEVSAVGKIRIQSAGVELIGGGISMTGTSTGSASPWSVDLSAPNGAIKIYAGGQTSEGRVGRRQEGTSSEADSPSLSLGAKENILIECDRKVSIHAAELDLTRTQKVTMGSLSSLEFSSGDKLAQSAAAHSVTTTKTSVDTHSGGNPMDGPCKEVKITSNPGTGAVPFTVQCDQSIQIGDWKRTIDMGDNTRVCKVGDQNINAWSGQVVMASLMGGNSHKVGTSGMSSLIGVGNASTTAALGSVSSVALTGISLLALGGPVSIRSTSAVTISAPGGAPGPVTTGGTRCTITGVPYLALTNCQSGVLITP